MEEEHTMMDLKDKLPELLEHLESGLVERETPVRLALLGALAGEHLLLIGPPGTAKSEIAGRLHDVFEDSDYFERLLTRFSVPEELFGPLSLEALEEDRYERKIEGYLPTATVAFIDEIFKANSAILNALLTLINERQFDNGSERIDVPLVCLIGASNELPEGSELDALYDRFLLRYQVEPVKSGNFVELLDGGEPMMSEVPDELKLSTTELQLVREEARNVELPDGIRDMLEELRNHLHHNEIYVSDRRWMQAVKLLKTAAYTNGRDEVSVFDAWLLQHCLWNEPEDREIVYEWYRDRVGADSVSEPGNFARVVKGLEATLENDRAQKQHARNEEGEPLYHDGDGGETTNAVPYHKTNQHGELLYLAPQGTDERDEGKELTAEELNNRFTGYNGEINSISKYKNRDENAVMVEPDPVLEPKTYSPEHKEGRLRRVEKALGNLETHLDGLEEKLDAIEQHVSADHWLPDSFASEASRQLEEKKDSAEDLMERLLDVQKGFEGLPVEDNPMDEEVLDA
jgi:MoxR-like ATPase